MYYILATIFFIIVYFALAKILSSILKGCLVTVGIFILLFSIFVFSKSSKEPVILFDTVVVDGFNVQYIGNVANDLVKENTQ